MNLNILSGLIFLAGAALAGCSPVVSQAPDAPTPPPAATQTALPPTLAPAPTLTDLSYRNITIQVEGIPVTLVDGVSEAQAAPGSAATIVTRYFGNEAFGDLNGDGTDDVAFLVTQTSGGTGTFYFVVAALRAGSGYQGTNAMLLGDRIAPQSTHIEAGQITVTYADRKPDEPFSAQPTVGVSRTFIVQSGILTEKTGVSPLTGRVYEWVETRLNDTTQVAPARPGVFTITFQGDGTFTGTTDCNSYFGEYRIEGEKLAFNRVGQTLMACDGSQEQVFLKQLVETESFLVNPDGTLMLLLKLDSGTMQFK